MNVFPASKGGVCGIYSIRTYRNNQPTCISQCRLFMNSSQDSSPKYTLKSKTFCVFKKVHKILCKLMLYFLSNYTLLLIKYLHLKHQEVNSKKQSN